MLVGCRRPSRKPLSTNFATLLRGLLLLNPKCCVSVWTAQRFSVLSELGWILCIDLVVQRQGYNCSAPVGWALKISTFSTYRSARTLGALHLLEKIKKSYHLLVIPVINYFLRIKVGWGSNGCNYSGSTFGRWCYRNPRQQKNVSLVDEKVKSQDAEL